MSKRLSNNGFGIVEILVAIALVAVIGLGGYFVWRKHEDKKVDSTNTQTSTTAQTKKVDTTTNNPYASWKTYTSTVGNLTFKYPSTWSIEGWVNDSPVATSAISGKETSLSISAPSNTANPENGRVGVSINFTTPNSTFVNSKNPLDGIGTTTTLQNGIKIWTNDKATDPNTVDPDAGNPTCAVTKILGKGDKSYYYGYPLNNGLYLEISTSYCEGQRSTTSLTYSAQVNSQERKDGISMISSIKFN
ncbi:MAG: hypothetical protein JWO41_459 [Candidatus Saccharibacteria bacterium]|nr:hypothetical protein [Candidatus Saccharibacteria bacterium]